MNEPSSQLAMKAHKRACVSYLAWRKEINLMNGKRGYEAVVERGEVEQWKAKIGLGVSKAIQSNPAEIERRQKLSKTTITAWAQSDEGRRTSSETAIKTSARPEIQQKRAKNLQNWRDDHPEEFQEIIRKMQDTWHSRPEMKLLEECKQIDSDFKHNQRVWNAEFSTLSHRRQIDILHPEKRIVIEFDGPYHFRKVMSDQLLEEVQKRDAEVNRTLVNAGYTVIRVTYEDYTTRRGGSFSERVKQVIRDAVYGEVTGLLLIGETYAKDR